MRLGNPEEVVIPAEPTPREADKVPVNHGLNQEGLWRDKRERGGREPR